MRSMTMSRALTAATAAGGLLVATGHACRPAEQPDNTRPAAVAAVTATAGSEAPGAIPVAPGAWTTGGKDGIGTAAETHSGDDEGISKVWYTIARGQLRADELLETGRINGELADQFPFPIDRLALERGQQRYMIYCSPCHAARGDGRGMIVQRGFPAPPPYYGRSGSSPQGSEPTYADLRDAPVGHFFDVMTHGHGVMYSYASRISVEESPIGGISILAAPLLDPSRARTPSTAAASNPGLAATATRASSTTRSGRFQRSRPAAMSAPITKVSSLPGSSSASNSSVR